jgi:hypothetical protein
MTKLRLHIARCLAVWLLFIPFKMTVWHHLCIASGKSNIALFVPTQDPCQTANAAQNIAHCQTSNKVATSSCCAKNKRSAADHLLRPQTPSPQASATLAATKNCCKSELQNLDFDSDKIGKNIQKDAATLIWETISLPAYYYKASYKSLFATYAPLLPQNQLPFAHAPPPPIYGKQKIIFTQIYRC